MLRNNTLEVECDLIARRQSANLSTEYSDCIIVNVFAELQDGPYLAVFEGHSMHTVKKRGIWLATGPIEPNADEKPGPTQTRIAELLSHP